MAGESAMKPVRALRSPMIDESWSSPTAFSDQRMLSTLGSNLRDVYDDLTESAQPSELLRLAAMIDERRGGDAS